MKLTEFLSQIEKPDQYLMRGWSREEINRIANEESFQNANQLQALFCYAKAKIDPSPNVKDFLRRFTGPDNLKMEFATTLEMHNFDYIYPLQEGIRDALWSLDHIEEKGKDPDKELQSLEWWYELECM